MFNEQSIKKQNNSLINTINTVLKCDMCNLLF